MLSAALVVIMLAGTALHASAAPVYNDAATTVPIGSSEDLVTYAKEYAQGRHNPEDVLQLSNSIDLFYNLTDVDFPGIGTSSRPFKGTVYIPEGTSTIAANRALFSYMTTDVVITCPNDGPLRFLRPGESANNPLLADYVLPSEASPAPTASWKVTVEKDDLTGSDTTANDFAGVIGTIGNGCYVNIEFTHNSSFVYENASGVSTTITAKASSSGDIGAICGSLGEGSELTFKINSAHVFDVNSTGGHAGGVVGIMGDGAKLIAADSYVSKTNVSTTASSKYAGGMAGHATNAEIEFQNSSTATISNTVSGTEGAGAVYGYYKSTENSDGASVRIFELNTFNTDTNLTVSGGSCAGGFIGRLEATNSITITETDESITDDNFSLNVRFTGGSYRGGLLGAFKNDTSGDNVLYIYNAETRIVENTGSQVKSAGAVGIIEGSSYSYVKSEDFRVKADKEIAAGLIGKSGSTETVGNFIDVCGTLKANGTCNSGIVSDLSSGVLRIQGTTDMSGATNKTAQLVGTRGSALVYALGNGDGSGWVFKRSSGITFTGNSKTDDIGDWGEVLRISSANGFAENTFFTVDMTHHTVTVAPHVQNMGSAADFVKTALNIQHNDGDKGCLKFSSGSTSSSLLETNLSITSDIDLSGTGIQSFTRDDGTNGYYKGTFNGNSHKITLAIGEAYGLKSTGAAVSSNDNAANGMIINHTHQGLFAKADGATFTGLTVAGFDHTAMNAVGFMGGLAAVSKGNLTLTDIITEQENRSWAWNKSVSFCSGGAIGKIDTGSTGTVNVTNCRFGTVSNDFRQAADYAGSAYYGGCIGYVETLGSNIFNFNNVQIGSGAASSDNNRLYQKNNDKSGKILYGGLIGVFKGTSTKSGSNLRKVNLRNITVNNGVEIQSKNMNSGARENPSAAFIGGVWNNVDVVIGDSGSENGITVGSTGSGNAPKIEVLSGSASANIGALFYQVTGRMDVHHVKVNGANVTSAKSPASFGFIVNETYCSDSGNESALYLNVDLGSAYNIAATTATAGAFSAAYDEIAAYSHKNGKDICENAYNSIVSLNIPGGAAVIMNGSGCNTYQNQTAYATKTNEHTRYYYNLEAIRTKGSPSPAEKLLMWSVNKYAQSKVKDLFKNGFTSTISGNCDMSGLSYYPVDASGMTINSGTVIKFYNEEIETGEGGSGNTDGSVRSTRSTSPKTQHYLMHEGVFRNYTGSLTVNGLTVRGNVSNQHGDNNSGFLICGTLGNSNNTRTAATIKNIVLDNAKIDRESSNQYGPLLINKIGTNTEFSLTGVTATNYPSSGTTAVASSLIGDVGSDTAENINMTFSNIKLDGRTAEGGLTGLSSAYGTDRSIFDRATLLNSFKYLRGSLAVYNYTHSEDWDAPLHRVTYGKEVKDSVEYAGKEDKYYGDTKYTHPTDSSGASAYDFSSGFLPYVYNGNNTYDPSTNNYHEIKVNVQDSGLVNGCGQYNHPYVITDGDTLATAAKIIGGQLALDMTVSLPSDLGADGNKMWHDTSGETDRVFTYKTVGGTTKFYAGNNDEYSFTADQVREYLAGAYYSILGSFTIETSSDYPGLGNVSDWNTSSHSTNFECKYAFRGVIIGNGNTITNNTVEPLVKSSNGCVIKDLTVKANAAITIQQAANSKFSYDINSCNAYGAVIGKVMGGDTIIDNVGVDFSGSNFSVNVSNSNNTYGKLMPVGGYIGVIVNGGVIFRNMAAVTNKTGLTASKCAKVTDACYLYVNPIIGRVIAGYAFNEADSYAASSPTLINGTVSGDVRTVKNYDICDLDPNSASLSVSATGAAAHTITAPDSQALYVLSCIVNSGAGSASYQSGSSVTNYATVASSPWIAYRNYTCVRYADYDEVGTSAALNGDYDKAKNDVYTGTAKVPYIITAYTNKSGNFYHARSICGNGGKAAVTSITLSNTSYDLGAGYRGIGNIYSGENAFKLIFNKLIGNNATVNLAMLYAEYDFAGANDDTRTNENYNEAANPGFGLFNTLYEKCNSDSDTIKDITLTGSVTHEAIKLSANTKTLVDGKIKDTSNAGVKSGRVLNVGGLAGYTAQSFNLDNVNMNGLTVTSMKNGGGLVGYAYNAVFNVKNCGTGANGVSVSARVKAGGMIGYVNGDSARINITQTDTSKTFIIDEIKMTFVSSTKGDYYSGSQWYFDYYSSGGLIGTAACGNTANVTKVSVTNVKISGKPNGTHKVYTAASILNHRDVAGGVIGSVLSTDYTISGVQISGVDVYGGVAGGIIGYDAFNNNTSGPTHTIVNSTFTGTSDTTISAIRSAGGIIGKVSRLVDKSKSKIQLSGNRVDSVTVCSIWFASSSYKYEDDCSAGTVIGAVRNEKGNNSGGLCEINVFDHISENCEVYTLFTNANTANEDGNCRESGAGGIVGSIAFDNSNYPMSFYGHNILLDNVTVRNYKKEKTQANFVSNARTTGFVCGNNYSNSVIRIAGLSFAGGNKTEISYISGKMAAAANTNHFGTDGYVVMADYSGVCTGSSKNTSDPTLYNGSTDPTDHTAAAPYVTVNPSGNIGSDGLFLTGDGISPTVSDLPIQEIIAPDKRYSAATVNNAAAFNTYMSKLSTFNAEQNTSLPYDFAVLIVDDVSPAHTTEMITAYINLLTNTNRTTDTGKKGYAEDASGFYRVVISKMVYDEGQGKFVKSNEEANLKINSSSKQFFMNMDSVDTAGVMFSLIDVQYYDPADTDKIAYHLYVPVLVKKLLTFDFNIATGSGTNYERAWYNDRWGSPMMENLGSPASIYFKFSYLRSKEEWQTAINNGENVLRNYAKKLNMIKAGTAHLPNDTILVLVDPSRGGKPYYARFNQVYNTSTGVLSLSGFREVLDDNTSAAFSPINLCEMLELTAAENATGTFVRCNSTPAQATVKVGDDFYRIATESDTSLQHYNITVGGTNDATTGYLDTEEPYYISFFTEGSSSNDVYHYTISAPNTFGDNANPSRIIDPSKLLSGNGIVHTILGNIFVQDNFTITTLPNDEEMSTLKNNSTLRVTMSSDVKIYEGVYNEISGYLMTGSIDVYQSFLMYLTRTDKNGVSKNIIAGDPDASATYSITSDSGVPSASPAATFTSYGSYAEISTGYAINSFITKNAGSTATVSSVITLVYETDIAIGEQFPNREDEEMTSVGTSVSGKSNIAYDPLRTSYSKSSTDAADSRGHVYYSHVDDRTAKLTYNVMRDVFGGDYGHLGINPLDSGELTEITVPTLAVYDISNIIEKAAAYDTVRVHIKLYRKVDGYNAMLDIPTYMQNIWHEGFDAAPTSENHLTPSDAANFRLTGDGAYTEYVYSFARSDLEANSALATSLEIPIYYIIYTGSVFEDRGLTYSNYKLNLEVELTKSATPSDVLSVSMASDFVIYTNARVLPDYVDAQ